MPLDPYHRTKTTSETWKTLAMLLGIPVIGGLIGGLIGRSFAGVAKGAAMGGVVGLAGCYDFQSLSREYGKGDGGKVDGGTSGLPDMVERSDLNTAPDMTAQPDMTHLLDMSKPNCVNSLAGVGTGDFTIRFRVATATTKVGAILFQRADCGHGNFWDVFVANEIWVETDDGGNYTYFGSASKVNDGMPHDVVIARAKGVISIFIDGAFSRSAPSLSILGNLPPLGIGTGNPCPDHPALDGTVTDVCLSR